MVTMIIDIYFDKRKLRKKIKNWSSIRGSNRIGVRG
jgi:hypothetical protein